MYSIIQSFFFSFEFLCLKTANPSSALVSKNAERTYLKCDHYTLFAADFCKTRIHTACDEVENKPDEAKRKEASDVQPVATKTSPS